MLHLNDDELMARRMMRTFDDNNKLVGHMFDNDGDDVMDHWHGTIHLSAYYPTAAVADSNDVVWPNVVVVYQAHQYHGRDKLGHVNRDADVVGIGCYS